MFEPRQHRIELDGSGSVAFLVIDDTTLGPAAGGIRTLPYADEAAALADAAALARAMTYKCALAGLPAGGGKAVVMLRPETDREAAFERLGVFIDGLDGAFLTAGDMGTRADDLRAVARRTRHVEIDEVGLAEAVGHGCVRAMLACRALAGDDGISGTRVAVQGCGTVGAAVARHAAAAGASVVVADLDEERADALAGTIDAEVVSPRRVLETRADIVAPCAAGGVLDARTARRLRTNAVCGAANNILAAAEVEGLLVRRGIVWVPDVISSAGAVILGVGRRLMGRADCDDLIAGVFDTALRVISEARRTGEPPGAVAAALAEARIRAAREER